MFKTIFFDLDGTLLGLDEDKFIKLYFGTLGKKFAGLGFEVNTFLNAVWYGTKKMRDNDGEKSNEDVFWPAFYEMVDGDKALIESEFLSFYQNDFDVVVESTYPSVYPKKIIELLKKHQIRIFLATNPLFPAIATHKRIQWAGLEPENFEWITTYENSNFSKPSLGYYKMITDKFGLDPHECMMVGNDAYEDMAAEHLGMDTFLVTNHLNNEHKKDISVFKNGTLEEFYLYLVKELEGE
ncbi:MAG: HAD family hydrolase [Candidatus Izemoplasmatales bacterium]